MAALTAGMQPPRRHYGSGLSRSARCPDHRTSRRGTGPPRSPPAPGPCGPGRCWSWRPRPRPRCGPVGSASRRRPGSGWSRRCRASGRRCTWTRPSPCPSASRRTRLTRCAPGPTGEHAVSDRTRRFAEVVRDLLLRTRHGRAGGLSPAGPGRGSAGAVARHHHRVLPAGPGPGDGDRAGPHASAPTPAPQRTDRTMGAEDLQYHGPTPRSAEEQAGRPRIGHAPDDSSGSGSGPPLEPGRPAAERRHGGTKSTRPLSARHAWPPGRLAAAGKPVSRRALRSAGIIGSNQALNALARTINAELAGTAVVPARPGNAMA